ncbi:hypothetical protein CHS0354_023767 [Potamilus streckersoni]|uniref:Peptidase S8/S53 domain-containing protein n=1 Tax=Potamilus streckersoni TaxID=2493646 RepID=A0AAE0RZ38_9BIVA|nr:hypothetical protein CHS0354_023767 [Potamilus streckersoni]
MSNFIPKKETFVDAFVKQNPDATGKGTIIVIIDTGIDPLARGLQKNSDGSNKIIDLIDVSGFGDVFLSKPIISQNGSKTSYQHPTNTNIRLFSMSPPFSNVLIGFFDEMRMQNTNTPDLDGDQESNSIFGVLLVDDGKSVYALIDANADQDISNEKPIQSYKESKDVFTFKTGTSSILNCALSIHKEVPKVVFSFDEDGHGTHVAGIAAGFNIYSDSSQRTFDGIAPDARLLGIKISNSSWDNISVTGSIKRAIDYAAKISILQQYPTIVNLSFGIGSELVEQADLEVFIDKVLLEHPNLYFCTSNGNNGPGLFSTGQPASSKSVISVGAMLTEGLSANGFGINRTVPAIHSFSSRSGDILKPDILAPGSAFYKHPAHASKILKSGTSMASPYIAGCLSIILSALNSFKPSIIQQKLIPQHVIKKAIISTATKIPPFSPEDIGAGLINVSSSYSRILEYIDKKLVFFVYSIFSESTFREKNLVQNYALYKTVESCPQSENFSINFSFPSTFTEFQKSNLFQIFSLHSSVDWLKPIQRSLILKGTLPSKISIEYQKSKILKKGLHFGTIYGTLNSSSHIAFQIPISIISPYFFSNSENNTLTFKNQLISTKISLNRYFFAIPENAASVIFKIKKKSSLPMLGIFNDPKGRKISNIEFDDNENVQTFVTKVSDVGIYELVIFEDPTTNNIESIQYDLTVKLNLFSLIPKLTVDSLLVVNILNSNPDVTESDVYASFLGYAKDTVIKIGISSSYKQMVIVNKADRSVQFNFSLSPTDLSKTTDIGVRLIDRKAFRYARLKYAGAGDWYNDPMALPNLMNYIERVTGIRTPTVQDIVEPSDPSIFSFSFVFMTGHGKVNFSTFDANNLRLYLEAGGFLYVDDDYGLAPSFMEEVKKIFPNEPLTEIPYSHSIYNIFFDFPKGFPKIHEHDGKSPRSYGIFLNNRLVLLFTTETNPSDGWVSTHNDAPEIREIAFKIGTNIVLTSLMR